MRPIQQTLPTPQPAIVPSSHADLGANRVPTVYEPHCLMTWAEMCAGMDDMAGFPPREVT